jgi:hypothetical protein
MKHFLQYSSKRQGSNLHKPYHYPNIYLESHSCPDCVSCRDSILTVDKLRPVHGDVHAHDD